MSPASTDCCFAHGGQMLQTHEALKLLLKDALVQTETRQVPLTKAIGRVLASNVIAVHNVPPHSNSAMDGFAFRYSDYQGKDTTLKLFGRIAAGDPMPKAPSPGYAVRIFTGAPCPMELDTIMMQEDVKVSDGQVFLPGGLKQGSHKRATGEDVRAGDQILSKGQRLRPQDIALAAACGNPHLTVYRKPRVAVFSTGDELYAPGEHLPSGGIFDANRYAVLAMLANLPVKVSDLGILPDNEAKITAALKAAAAEHDLIFTSGGVSVGDEDHVKKALETLGGVTFWKIAIKPGKPLAFGSIGKCGFIGLPGNPVSTMVTFMRFARPYILKMAGMTKVAPVHYALRCTTAIKHKPGRREWIRAKLVRTASGHLQVEPFRQQGSGILNSMVQSDGLIEIPEDVETITEGSIVDFLPFNEVLG